MCALVPPGSDLSAALLDLYVKHNSPSPPAGERIEITNLWKRTKDDKFNTKMDALFGFVGYVWNGHAWLTHHDLGSQNWQNFQNQGQALLMKYLNEPEYRI